MTDSVPRAAPITDAESAPPAHNGSPSVEETGGNRRVFLLRADPPSCCWSAKPRSRRCRH